MSALGVSSSARVVHDLDTWIEGIRNLLASYRVEGRPWPHCAVRTKGGTGLRRPSMPRPRAIRKQGVRLVRRGRTGPADGRPPPSYRSVISGQTGAGAVRSALADAHGPVRALDSHDVRADHRRSGGDLCGAELSRLFPVVEHLVVRCALVEVREHRLCLRRHVRCFVVLTLELL